MQQVHFQQRFLPIYSLFLMSDTRLSIGDIEN